jgi:tetratricopeptide (TPR) repeat protein
MRARFWAVLCLCVSCLSPIQAQSAVEALNEAGWKMLEQGDGARAARLFADALALQPDEPVLLFGASVSAHLQGRSSEAKPRLRRALEVNPRFTPASLLLGEIVYSEGDLDLAIKTYEKALTLEPKNSDLTARLQAWRQEADVHSTFVERRQDRFRVKFEGRTDAQVAARATEVLNAEFWRIGKELGAYPSDTVAVILYTEKQFRDITRAPEWSGGLYDGQIRIPAAGAVQKPQLFERVLIHELTHSMIASIAPRGVPAWLHEGLAQQFEGQDPRAARRRLLAHGQRVPLEQLGESFTGLTAAGAQVAYDESLVAVSAMRERSRFTWAQLLNALARSDRVDETLRGYGVAYADLEAALAR